MADRKEAVATPEDAPRLKSLEIQAINVNIGVAIRNIQGGAGDDQLDWVVKTKNLAKAKKMLKPKDGHYYYFPNSVYSPKTGDPRVPPGNHKRIRCAIYGGGTFGKTSFWLHTGWNYQIDHVVVLD